MLVFKRRGTVEDRDESRSRGESLSTDESWVTGASRGRGETRGLRGNVEEHVRVNVGLGVNITLATKTIDAVRNVMDKLRERL